MVEVNDRKMLSVSVISRFMSEKEMADLITKYESSLTKRGARGVNEFDFEVLEHYRKGLSLRSLSEKFNVSLNKIQTSLRLAALAKLG